jgi:hypothetical protein
LAWRWSTSTATTLMSSRRQSSPLLWRSSYRMGYWLKTSCKLCQATSSLWSKSTKIR